MTLTPGTAFLVEEEAFGGGAAASARSVQESPHLRLHVDPTSG